MQIKQIGADVAIKNIPCFNVENCVFSGQTFRWTKKSDGTFHGIAMDKSVDIEQNSENIIFKNISIDDFNIVWRTYFDLDTDYEKILSCFNDETIKKAVTAYYGIRILNQDPWETLCSFIISQNNNIPRIKGIISRLCNMYGEKISGNDYAFPKPEKLAELNKADLIDLRAGFRTKYILDAARKTANGEIQPEKIHIMSIEEAAKELKKIKGVGDKVAACTLLYGYGKKDAFPVDVWVKRIMQYYYPDGLPKCTEGYKGVAQMYLFEYFRNKKTLEEYLPQSKNKN